MNLANASRRRGLAACLLCLLPGGLSFTAFAQGTEVVARVGNTDVTEAEVQTYLQGLSADDRKKVLSNPELLKELLRSHFKEVILNNEARAKGWDRRADVQAKIEQESKKIVDLSYLESVSVPPPDYPSPQDVQTFYDSNKPQFTDARAYHLAEIFIKTGADADDAARSAAESKADELVRRARAPGADFASLVRENSPNSAAAAKGGDLGFFTAAQLQDEARSAVTSMAVGSVSKPIAVPGGIAILHLIETRPPTLHPFGEVQSKIHDYMRLQRQQELEKVYLENLMKNSPVTINEIALSKLGDSLK